MSEQLDKDALEAAWDAMIQPYRGDYDDGEKIEQVVVDRDDLQTAIAAYTRHLSGTDSAGLVGWVLVPKEPTEEMITAGRIARMNIEGGYSGPSSWEAMIAAAPTPTGDESV